MQQYKIKSEGIREIRKRTLYILGIIFLIIVIIAVISIVAIPKQATDQMNISFIIVVLTAFISASMYRGIGKQKMILESYQLTIDKNLIATEQMRTPAVTIYYDDIAEIIKNKKGSFDIKSKTTKDVIIIPSQTGNYKEIGLLLSKIKPAIAKN